MRQCQTILDRQVISFFVNHLKPEEWKHVWNELGLSLDPLARQASTLITNHHSSSGYYRRVNSSVFQPHEQTYIFSDGVRGGGESRNHRHERQGGVGLLVRHHQRRGPDRPDRSRDRSQEQEDPEVRRRLRDRADHGEVVPPGRHEDGARRLPVRLHHSGELLLTFKDFVLKLLKLSVH